ncbi:MAG: response regulator transcription factor [Muribaculaceae bacterium]|nr:response regulator transcription factor [Muribaculaceae bacterium]
MAQTYSFIIFDNQYITRIGMMSLINSRFNAAECCMVHDKESLVKALEHQNNAIVILDYTLSDIRSYDELMILSHRFSGSVWIHFSAELSGRLIRQLTGEPVVSIIMKDCDEDEIVNAIMAASGHQSYLCQQVIQFVDSQPKESEIINLTSSETDILKMIAKGMSVKEIAVERCSSTHTITTHKKNIFRKLDVNTVYEATKYALRAGIVEMSDYYI